MRNMNLTPRPRDLTALLNSDRTDTAIPEPVNTETGKNRKNEIDSAFILLRPMHSKRHNNVCDELVIRQCRRRLISHTVLGIRKHEPDGLVQALSTESVTEQQKTIEVRRPLEIRVNRKMR